MEFGSYIAAHAHRHSQGRLGKHAVQSRLKIASHLQRVALHCTILWWHILQFPVFRFIATQYSYVSGHLPRTNGLGLELRLRVRVRWGTITRRTNVRMVFLEGGQLSGKGAISGLRDLYWRTTLQLVRWSASTICQDDNHSALPTPTAS